MNTLPRLNTRLESEAAEFLVLGNLLLERIATYKTYTNMPGYDLVATDPERNTSAKIQVKSRWRTNAPGFPIKNFGCDFVVFCRLNRGSKKGNTVVRAPEFYVFPVGLVRDVWNPDDSWGKISIARIAAWETYLNRWDLIRDFLGSTAHAAAVGIRTPTTPFAVVSARISPAPPAKPLSMTDFRRRLATLDGQRLVTPVQKKGFVVHVLQSGLEITPDSSGMPRMLGWPRTERVLRRYNETGSVNPGDYGDITHHSSYFLAVLKAMV